MSCVVKAFVDATLISGPANVNTVFSTFLAKLDPKTLQILATWAFPTLTSIAARVSAVSPD